MRIKFIDVEIGGKVGKCNGFMFLIEIIMTSS